ncbi:hypothetical protein E4U21_001770 [Claviceps maximensis]|nr:hypothetical protein E4U21_001770 [Claviceps maximensis]
MESDHKACCDDALPVAKDDSQGPKVTWNSHLQAGGRFVIKGKNSSRFLTVVGGIPVLQICEDMGRIEDYWHWHWDCDLESGWFRLQNRVTGTYIGVGKNLQIKTQPDSDKNFSRRLTLTWAPDGSQTLNAVSPQGRLLRIMRRSESNELMLNGSGGVDLEFIKIEK